MKKFKKQALLLVALLISASLLFTGCGSSQSGSNDQNPKKTVLKIGATPAPHAEILEFVKPLLAEEGIDLDIIVFNDYVQPNLALDSGDIDANFFQHTPYLESFCKERNLDLTSIAKVHIEPIGLYSKKITAPDQLEKGAKVVIPNDPSNGGRALILLEKAGLIKLREGAGLEATVQDITSNPKELNITMLDAAQLPRVLQDVAAAVINTNFALEGGLNPLNDAIFLEETDSPYSNILVVKTDRANDENLQKLAKVLTSDKVRQFIKDTYKGAILPSF